ncbi:hypothetical protein PQR66_24265 [Paraburkholderia agricolaris]|uniref:Uncharacterized protein n=1 Tax=Paraburkholderia agricolaris TaxID=2152888 RepID=A0ABW8ZSH3_9BURK
MRSNKRSILTPVTLLIPSIRSYWATHFYSLLKCIHSHRNLVHSPRNFKEYPLWTMSLLRGNLPPNFFEAMEAYLRNWGAQYFLASLFNQKVGENIIVELIERLEDLYGACFNKNLDSFAFHVSGSDSALSSRLSDGFTEIFPFRELTGSVEKLIAYSDLCLILENNFTGGSVAIFGEVEGAYGNKLRTEAYWGRKQEFCVFAVGVVEGSQKQIYFEESRHRGIDRVLLLIEKSHFVVNDFTKTLHCFKWLFLYGPNFEGFPGDDEFRYFSGEMRKRWSDPIDSVFSFLEGFITGGDLIGFNNDGIQIITDPQVN